MLMLNLAGSGPDLALALSQDGYWVPFFHASIPPPVFIGPLKLAFLAKKKHLIQRTNVWMTGYHHGSMAAVCLHIEKQKVLVGEEV